MVVTTTVFTSAAVLAYRTVSAMPGAVGENFLENITTCQETMQKIADELEKVDGVKFAHYLDTYSGDKYFVEVFIEAAGKWNSIKRLKSEYGFDRVVVFGDNANDVEMMLNADEAIAVGNALPPALEVADAVIDTNDNDGVAKYLLKLKSEGKL